MKIFDRLFRFFRRKAINADHQKVMRLLWIRQYSQTRDNGGCVILASNTATQAVREYAAKFNLKVDE